jgi:hypothetical protein
MAVAELKPLNYAIYVDWIDGKQWDRSAVTSRTVDGLRERMRQCRCLLFAMSQNSRASKWTPWVKNLLSYVASKSLEEHQKKYLTT